MTALTLYHCNISYASQKVRLYCYEKGLPWVSKHIDLHQQEHLTKAYRKINPKCTVPVIKDTHGVIICDSTAIMIHLEKQYPRQPILLKDKIKKDILAICYQHEVLQDPYLKILSFHYLFMPKGKQTQKEITRLLRLAKSCPDPAQRIFMKKAIQGEFSEAEIRQSEAQYLNCISAYEQPLKTHDFICGAEYTLADIVVTATVYRLMQMGYHHWFSSLPNLLSWYQTIQKRPSFDKTFI